MLAIDGKASALLEGRLEVEDGRVELRGRIHDHELAIRRIAGNGTGDTRWKVPGLGHFATVFLRREGLIMTAQDRADVYTGVTAEIIAAIEQGAGEWHAPWFHDGTSAARPTNISSGKRYRGINTVALWVAAMAAGYGDGLWGTYRQWQDAGAQVRKGERSTTVVLWKQIASSAPAGHDDHDDDEDGHRRMFARAFSVFNVAQVDGYERPPTDTLPENERFAHAEAFIGNLGIKTMFGGSEAYYLPSSDTVFMPDFASFRDAASFYGTWTHENGHASGAKHPA